MMHRVVFENQVIQIMGDLHKLTEVKTKTLEQGLPVRLLHSVDLIYTERQGYRLRGSSEGIRQIMNDLNHNERGLVAA